MPSEAAVNTRVVSPKRLGGLIGVSLAALLTVVAVLRDRAGPDPPILGVEARDAESAKVRVLPFRQSGLIFHWADEAPSVYVRRVMWDALSEDERKALCRSIAVAKAREEVTVFDETLRIKLAICTANGDFRPLRE